MFRYIRAQRHRLLKKITTHWKIQQPVIHYYRLYIEVVHLTLSSPTKSSSSALPTFQSFPRPQELQDRMPKADVPR